MISSSSAPAWGARRCAARPRGEPGQELNQDFPFSAER
uniref:Uncharacterized protein n=1 Tax=Arundo donax TaxID=35708 RepID=A0A0A9CAB6_ARUDO